MSKSWIIRESYLVVLLLAALWLPAWFFWLAALAAIALEPHYYEVLLPALFFDVLYGAPGAGWFGFAYVATALLVVLVYLSDELRYRLRL